MNWKKGLGPFHPLLGDIKSMRYQQERIKYDDKAIIGKDHGKVVCSTIVWAQGPIHGVKMYIALIKTTIVLRGVEEYTMDVREMMFMKRTIERLCTHVSRCYVCKDLSQLGFMEIKLFMNISNRNCNMFDPVGDLIRLDDINSGLAILQVNDSFMKLNTKIL